MNERDRQIEMINAAVRDCRQCPLSATRNRAVPGDGSWDARIMFVGEGPGRQEDMEGRPFVGAAGKLLSELLSMIGLRRDQVFITNVVKCRPPGNRDPLDEEKEKCLPYLRKQVLLIKPAAICVLGRHALNTLAGKEHLISRVHGTAIEKGHYRFFALYHPAAALYNQQLKETMIEDFRRLEKYLKENELLTASCTEHNKDI